MMAILAWILFGLVVGALAKLMSPGREPSGFIVTVVLGIGGAVLGGWLSQVLGVASAATVSFGGFIMSILGAVILLAIYNVATESRSSA